MSSALLAEVEKWRNYALRLIDLDKFETPEFVAVEKRLNAAMRAVAAAPPPPAKRKIKAVTNSNIIVVYPAVAKQLIGAGVFESVQPAVPNPKPKKQTILRPSDDGTAEDWQKYLDDLALAGEEDSAEYIAGKYRLEKAKRPRLRGPYPAIEHPDGAIQHDWPRAFALTGKVKAYHLWERDEQERGLIPSRMRGRKRVTGSN